jgi:hypothetical protein
VLDWFITTIIRVERPRRYNVLAENSLDQSHRYQSLEMLMFRLLFTDSTTHGFPFAALLLDPSCLGVCTIHRLILPVMEEDFPTLDVNCQYVRVGYIF